MKKAPEKGEGLPSIVGTGMRHYICQTCNSEYDAMDKYDLSEHQAHVDFGIDIDEYQETEPDSGQVNVIMRCDNCYEEHSEVDYEPKDVDRGDIRD